MPLQRPTAYGKTGADLMMSRTKMWSDGFEVAMLKRLCRYSLAFLLIVVGFSEPIPAQEKKLHTVNLGYSAISGSFAPL
jgi:hypothetical protein